MESNGCNSECVKLRQVVDYGNYIAVVWGNLVQMWEVYDMLVKSGVSQHILNNVEK